MVVKRKNKPKFNVPNVGFMKSVKARWRRPRGVDNKQRIRKRSAGRMPRIGYRNAQTIRFLHPSGLKEVLVHNLSELLSAGKDVCIRVAGGVGGKKRIQLEKKAGELKLPILNPMRNEKNVAGKPGAKPEVKQEAKTGAKPETKQPKPTSKKEVKK